MTIINKRHLRSLNSGNLRQKVQVIMVYNKNTSTLKSTCVTRKLRDHVGQCGAGKYTFRVYTSVLALLLDLV